MNKETYLKKFSSAVRWMLPKSDADEVLADYDEILSEYSEEDENIFVKELGEPVQAAKLLSEPKVYHRWLVAFSLMAFCLLISEFLILRANFNNYSNTSMYIIFILGLSVSFIWFRPKYREKHKSTFPPKLLLMLFVLIVCMVVTAVIVESLFQKNWNFIPFEIYGVVVYRTLLFTGTLATIFGLFGLIKARLSDYRWRSLYVMSLTLLVECVLILAILVSMGSLIHFPITNLIVIGVIGFIFTVVSIC